MVCALDVDSPRHLRAGLHVLECLTGQAALAPPQPAVALANLLEGQPVRVSEPRAGLPEALGRLVLRMIAKNRNDRPTDVGDVPGLLDALAAEAGSGAT